VPYRIVLTPAARRDLDALPAAMRRRIDARIRELSQQPRPPGVEKLQGAAALYRRRVGDYRILYAIEGEAQQIVIVRVGHRRDIYRRL
jgi:mRNA interferase RelE/StbE